MTQVARDLGINQGTLGNWVNADRRRRGDGTELGEDERAELARLLDDLFQGVSGRRRSANAYGLAGVIVVPDGGGQRQDELQDADEDSCGVCPPCRSRSSCPLKVSLTDSMICRSGLKNGLAAFGAWLGPDGPGAYGRSCARRVPVHVSAGGRRNWQRGPAEFARRPSRVASGASSSSATATYHPS